MAAYESFHVGASHYVEPSLNTVTGPEGATRLEPKAMQVLVCLATHAGRVVPKDLLISTVWAGTFVTDDVLTRCISDLRRVFGDDAKQSHVIQTIPKSGYRLIADVAVDGSPPSSGHSSEHSPGLLIGGVGLAVVLLGAAVGGFWMHRRSSAPGVPPAASVLGVTLPRVPLTSLPGQETAPAFSPEGNQVAFVWDGDAGNEDIYVQLIGAGAPLRLTTNPNPDRNPAWSPDGRYIAFVRVSPMESGVFIVPALGGAERRIAGVRWENHWDLYGAGLSWSPDAKFIAISDKAAAEDSGGVFVLAIDGSRSRQLTSPPPGNVRDVAPAISPDGRTVAFIRVTSGGVGEIYLVPFVGGEPRRLTFADAWLERIAWTPDGHDLVYSSGGGLTDGTLWRVSASGGAPERLPVPDGNAASPALAARGNRLAYAHRSFDANVWQFDVATSPARATPVRAVLASTRYEGGPQYSPDGKRIAFHSDRGGAFEIWASDADGANSVQLTTLGSSNTGTPRWSPDGRHIAFDARVGGAADIFVIDPDGGPAHRLTTESTDDVVPSWSRDGRWVYFASKRTPRWEVWKVPADGGRAVQVTRQGGFAAFESSDGRTLYYTKGLTVGGLWRVPTSGGDETPVMEFPKPGYWGYWALAANGVYFVNSDLRPFALEFLEFATGRVAHVAALVKPPVTWESGLALSPDERSLLYLQVDQMNSDIALVENFK
jgi:Tol biopolymer transport system component/DNA-binding winged helix-turn-helix (wHTH) protein